MLHASHCLHRAIAHNITIPITHVEREEKKALPYRFPDTIPKPSDANLAEMSREEMMRRLEKSCKEEMQRSCTFVTAVA